MLRLIVAHPTVLRSTGTRHGSGRLPWFSVNSAANPCLPSYPGLQARYLVACRSRLSTLVGRYAHQQVDNIQRTIDGSCVRQIKQRLPELTTDSKILIVNQKASAEVTCCSSPAASRRHQSPFCSPLDNRCDVIYTGDAASHTELQCAPP